MCLSPECRFGSLSSAASSAGAKPNHGFFYCQHSRATFFLARPDAAGHGARRWRKKCHRPCPHARTAAATHRKKKLVFSCARASRTCRRTPSRHRRRRAPASAESATASVCRLKIFFAKGAVPASHKRKCANFEHLRGASKTRASCLPEQETVFDAACPTVRIPRANSRGAHVDRHLVRKRKRPLARPSSTSSDRGWTQWSSSASSSA